MISDDIRMKRELRWSRYFQRHCHKAEQAQPENRKKLKWPNRSGQTEDHGKTLMRKIFQQLLLNNLAFTLFYP